MDALSQLKKILHRQFEGDVYNFTVSMLQCYAVGHIGVLVHNSNGNENAPALPAFNGQTTSGVLVTNEGKSHPPAIGQSKPALRQLPCSGTRRGESGDLDTRKWIYRGSSLPQQPKRYLRLLQFSNLNVIAGGCELGCGATSLAPLRHPIGSIKPALTLETVLIPNPIYALEVANENCGYQRRL